MDSNGLLWLSKKSTLTIMTAPKTLTLTLSLTLTLTLKSAAAVAMATTTTTTTTSTTSTTATSSSAETVATTRSTTLDNLVGSSNLGNMLDGLLVAVLIVLILVSIIGNLLVCVAIFTERKLRKLGNAFIVSLAIADLFVSCLVMTFALCNELLEYWPFGQQMCDLWQSLDIMCSTASILNLCAISLDRFIMIKDCLLYNRLMTRRVALCALVLIWFISALVSFVPITLGWHKPGHHFIIGSESGASAVRVAASSSASADNESNNGPKNNGSSEHKQKGQDYEHEHEQYTDPDNAHNQEHGFKAENKSTISDANNVESIYDSEMASIRSDRERRNSVNELGDQLLFDAITNELELAKPSNQLSKFSLASPESISSSKYEDHSSDRNHTLTDGLGSKLKISTTSEPRSKARKPNKPIDDAPNSHTTCGNMIQMIMSSFKPINFENTLKRLGETTQEIGKLMSSSNLRKNPNPNLSDDKWALYGPGRRHVKSWSDKNNKRSNMIENSAHNSASPLPLPLLQSSKAALVSKSDYRFLNHGTNNNNLNNNDWPNVVTLRQRRSYQDSWHILNHSIINEQISEQHHSQNQNQNHKMIADNQAQCILSLTPSYAIISSTISFYIPCIIMIGLYTKLYACARKHVKNIQSISKAPAPIVIKGPSQCKQRQVNANKSGQAIKSGNDNTKSIDNDITFTDHDTSTNNRSVCSDKLTPTQADSNNVNVNNICANYHSNRGVADHYDKNFNDSRYHQVSEAQTMSNFRPCTCTDHKHRVSFSMDHHHHHNLNNNNNNKRNNNFDDNRRLHESSNGENEPFLCDIVNDCSKLSICQSTEIDQVDHSQNNSLAQDTRFNSRKQRNCSPKINHDQCEANLDEKCLNNSSRKLEYIDYNDNDLEIGSNGALLDYGNNLESTLSKNDNNNNRNQGDQNCHRLGILDDPQLVVSGNFEPKSGTQLYNRSEIKSSASQDERGTEKCIIKHGTNAQAKSPIELVEAKQNKAKPQTDIPSSISNKVQVHREANKKTVKIQNDPKKQAQVGPSITTNSSSSSSGHLATHKAAMTLGIIMGTFLFCWVPFFCINIIKAFCSDCITSSMFRFFTWLGYANSALNPIIYGIHNSEFRCAFNRIFFKHLSLKSNRDRISRRFSHDTRQAANRRCIS